VVVAAALHQFAAAALLLILLLLLGNLTWRDLIGPRLRLVPIAGLTSLAFWSAFGVATVLSGEGAASYWVSDFDSLMYEFLAFPDVYDIVVRPLLAAAPILTLVVVAMVALGIGQIIGRPSDASPAQRQLTIVLVVLVALVGLSEPPRYETRYVFFLYPLAVALALAAVARAIDGYVDGSRAVVLLTLVALFAFGITEDWNPRHLRRIDDTEVVSGEGLSGRRASHLVRRADIRSLGRWLDGRAAQSGTIVISGIAGLEYYYRGIDYMYVDGQDDRFADWSCRRGTVERWTNLPLLHTPDAVLKNVGGSSRALLVLYEVGCQKLRASLSAGELTQTTRVAWRNANVCVLETTTQR
jgi:hypothetical protein